MAKARQGRGRPNVAQLRCIVFVDAVNSTQELVNSREWRGAEVPAANGHATARSLAALYGALATAPGCPKVRGLGFGFGYVMNQMGSDALIDGRAATLFNTIFAAL